MKNKLLCLLVSGIVTFCSMNVEAGYSVPTQEVEKGSNIQVISDSTIQDYFQDAVLVGDSIALGYYYYACRNKNAVVAKMSFLTEGGFGAKAAFMPLDREVHPLYKGERQYVWDSIAMMGAKKVFISYGMNDLNPLNKRLVSKHKEVIDKILEKSPDVSIVILSITPVLKGAESGRINNEFIPETNEQLKQMALENGWGYMDVASEMTDEEGNLKPEYCSDGFVHISRPVYSMKWDPLFRRLAKSELITDGAIWVDEMKGVVVTKDECEVYTIPDVNSEVLLKAPANFEIVIKGKTSNGLYQADLGDGKDYYISEEKVAVSK